MASKKSEYYQLHIWEPEDNFLRTEFNENNEKLDTALGELARTVATKPTHFLLMDSATTEAATQVSADLSGVELTAWRELKARFFVPSSSAAVMLRLNGGTSYYTATLGGSYSNSGVDTSAGTMSWTSATSPIEITMTLPLYMTEWSASVQWSFLCLPTNFRWHTQGFSRAVGLAWADLQTLDVVSEGGIPAGTHIQVWGVK